MRSSARSTSVVSHVAANFRAFLPCKSSGTLALLLLMVIPFSAPVFGSVLLEGFGPIDAGCLAGQTPKHTDYAPPRVAVF